VVIKAKENGFNPIALGVLGKLIDHAISGVSPDVGCAIKTTGGVGNQITPRKTPVATLPKRVKEGFGPLAVGIGFQSEYRTRKSVVAIVGQGAKDFARGVQINSGCRPTVVRSSAK